MATQTPAKPATTETKPAPAPEPPKPVEIPPDTASGRKE